MLRVGSLIHVNIIISSLGGAVDVINYYANLGGLRGGWHVKVVLFAREVPLCAEYER